MGHEARARTLTHDMALTTDPTPVEAYVPASPEAVAAAPGAMPPPEFWTQLIDTLRTNKAADQETAAQLHAMAMKKALRPENEISPMISVFNPKGETQYPRPKPRCIFLMGPYPIAEPSNYDTATWTEIELLNQLRPGDYLVTKADGTDVKLTVKVEYESNGVTPFKTTLLMPIADDDQKANWPPLVQLLTQIVTGEAPMQSFARLSALIVDKDARIAALEAQLAGSQA